MDCIVNNRGATESPLKGVITASDWSTISPGNGMQSHRRLRKIINDKFDVKAESCEMSRE